MTRKTRNHGVFKKISQFAKIQPQYHIIKRIKQESQISVGCSIFQKSFMVPTSKQTKDI